MRSRAGAARTLAILTAATLAAVSCTSSDGPAEPRAPMTTSLDDLRGETVPDGSVAGTIAGEAFLSEEVYLLIERRPGRERIDLLLTEHPIERCGLPGAWPARGGRVAWLRVAGVTELTPGELTVEPDGAGPLSVHYEERRDGAWRGFGRGLGRLVVQSVTEGIVTAQVQACFDDGAGSCVRGRVRVTECRSEVDLSPSGERFTNAPLPPSGTPTPAGAARPLARPLTGTDAGASVPAPDAAAPGVDGSTPEPD